MKLILLLLFVLNPAKDSLVKEYYLTHSGNAAYNIGVIEYEKGNYPEAIFWWRIACLKNPEDFQAESNIKTAKRKLGLSNEFIKFNPRGKFFNPDLFAVLFLVVFGLLSIYMLLSAFKILKFHKILVLTLAIFSILFFYISFKQWHSYRNPAVCVVMKNTYIYHEPGGKAEISEIKAGVELKIEKVVGAWVKVKTPWGGSGWMKRQNLRLILSI